MSIKIIVVLAAIGALAGCETTATHEDFGTSVDSLIKAQAFNPETLTTPSGEAVTGIDQDYVRNVLDVMRKDVSKPEETREPIQMVIWGGSGGSGGW